ncbi:MAG: NADH-quinone oxidoreductase subunit A [Chloroflexi bacterium]|nr:NADH-quinone oxidoreductase subunit A [Chloroflexota bacterium]MDA8236873.1 NADH-quinone oxidoreductase subunit A [Chloroflexota bacterium]
MVALGPLAVSFAVFVAGFAVVLASWWLGGRPRSPAQTAPERVPFGGGADPRVHAWNRYHVRYYSMALIFLAFDMEMVFMYPWAVVFVREGLIAMVEMGMFITILLLGVLYAWRERALEWA